MSSENPLVSVITPFLNEEKFLKEAVASVFAQTYGNWELLLVDDGSTDDSTQIAKEYAKQYPDKVFYLEHEGHKNKGTSASRNLGLAHSHGDLIAYIDGDDIWLPRKLERQVDILRKQPLDVGAILSPVYFLFEDGRKERQILSLNFSPGIYQRGSCFDKYMEALDNSAATCGILIRKDIITDVGGSEESFTGYFEDAVLWLKITLRTSIYYDQECVSLYRIHPSSNSHSFSYKQQMVFTMNFYNWLREYLKNKYEYILLGSDLFSLKSFFAISIMRDCHQSQQLETIAALSYLLEPLMPKVLKNPEWNYFTGVAFQYILTDFEEALRRYDIALQYGFDESGVPLQYGFDEFGVRLNRGILHSRFGHFREAHIDLQRALELKPDRQDVEKMLQNLTESYDVDKKTLHGMPITELTQNGQNELIDTPMGVLLSLYYMRSDLQQAFPEVIDHDYRRLLKWARDTVKEKTGDHDTDKLNRFAEWYMQVDDNL